MIAGLERLTIADLTDEHVGVQLLVSHRERTWAGGLTDIQHGHMFTRDGSGAVVETCAYVLYLGGRTLMLPGDALVLAALPVDPCDGTPLTDEPAVVLAAPSAPAPATPQETTDDDDLPAVAQRPAAHRTPRPRPRPAVRRRLAALLRRARRAPERRATQARLHPAAHQGPAPRRGTRPMMRALALAVLLAGAGVVVALASPPLSGGTITAALLITTSGAITMQARRVALGGTR